MSTIFCLQTARPLSVLFFTICFLLTSDVFSKEIPGDVLSHLHNWDNRLDPITVEWVRTRASDYPVEELLEKMKSSFPDHAFLDPQMIHCCFQKKKIHSRIEENRSALDENGTFLDKEKDVLNFSFDGQLFYNWSGEVRDVKNTSLWIHTRETQLNHSSGETPIFRADTYFPYIGIKFPNTADELNTSTRSNILHLLESSVLMECEETDGLWKIVLEEDFSIANMKILHTYHLKPEWNFLAARYSVQYIPNGVAHGLISRREIESFDYKKLPDASYSLPHKVVSKIYNFKDELLYTEEFNVTLASAKIIAEDHFVLKESRSGTTIIDYTLPEAKNLPEGRVEYVIPWNKDDLNKVIAAAKKGTSFTPLASEPVNTQETAPHRQNQTFHYLIISVMFSLILIIFIIILRRRKLN